MNLISQINIGDTFDSPWGKDQGYDLSSLVSLILRVSPVLAGVLLLFFLIFSGIAVIISSGSNNPEGAQKAKAAASGALIGFIVIFMAYWFIRLIEIITGVDFTTSPALP